MWQQKRQWLMNKNATIRRRIKSYPFRRRNLHFQFRFTSVMIIKVTVEENGSQGSRLNILRATFDWNYVIKCDVSNLKFDNWRILNIHPFTKYVISMTPFKYPVWVRKKNWATPLFVYDFKRDGFGRMNVDSFDPNFDHPILNTHIMSFESVSVVSVKKKHTETLSTFWQIMQIFVIRDREHILTSVEEIIRAGVSS